MNVVALIQARLGGATRFGGPKVLENIAGKTMLERVVERVRMSKLVSEVVVVMPLDPAEDALAEYCAEKGWKCDRTQVRKLKNGSWDVLGAFTASAFHYRINPVVRVTADCPLIDHGVIDACIQLYAHGGPDGQGVDYVSNNLERTFPHGLDVEVFGVHALKDADARSTDEFDREHVTEFIRRNQDRPFKLANVRFPLETVKRIHVAILVGARLTVDYPEDLQLMREIHEALAVTHGADHHITTADVVGLLEAYPALMAINEQRAIDHMQALTGHSEPLSVEQVEAEKRAGLRLLH